MTVQTIPVDQIVRQLRAEGVTDQEMLVANEFRMRLLGDVVLIPNVGIHNVMKATAVFMSQSVVLADAMTDAAIGDVLDQMERLDLTNIQPSNPDAGNEEAPSRIGALFAGILVGIVLGVAGCCWLWS